MDLNNLKRQFGNIDIYLFDQILKGRFTSTMRILDAGCGDGRNLVYFLSNAFQVYGVDRSSTSIERLQLEFSTVKPRIPADNFRVEEIESISFDDAYFDGVICNAVLHFAEDEHHFDAMLKALWQVLKSGGVLFARLASSIGIEDCIQHVHGRRYRLPDTSTRFLVDEKMLLDYTDVLGATLIEPIKTVNVQNQRCMTTWVLRKKTVII